MIWSFRQEMYQVWEESLSFFYYYLTKYEPFALSTFLQSQDYNLSEAECQLWILMCSCIWMFSGTWALGQHLAFNNFFFFFKKKYFLQICHTWMFQIIRHIILYKDKPSKNKICLYKCWFHLRRRVIQAYLALCDVIVTVIILAHYSCFNSATLEVFEHEHPAVL